MLITLDQAAALGYREIYASWDGIGDQICFMFALQTRFKRTHKKTVIFTSWPELYEGADFCDVIPGVRYGNFLEQCQEAYKRCMWVHFISPTLLKWLNKQQNLVCWPQRHIAAQYCAAMGLSGTVDIQPSLQLTDREKTFGRFYKSNQIAVMTGGMQCYKTWDTEKMQHVINCLRGRYHFVQIGVPSDPPLKHVLPLHRKKLSVRQTACVLYNSDCFIGSIGGLQHLAKCVGCPSVITYSSAEPPHLAYYPENIYVYAKNACARCAENRHDPQHEHCPHNYECIRKIGINGVLHGVEEIMSRRTKNNPVQNVSLTPDPISGLEHFLASLQTKCCPEALFRKKRYIMLSLIGLLRFHVVRTFNQTRFLLWFLPVLTIEYKD